MKQTLRLVLFLVFVLVPGVTLLWGDRAATLRQSADLEQEALRRLAWHRDRVEASLDLDAQVNLLFDRFGDEALRTPGRWEACRAFYRRHLAPGLPPHDLQVFSWATAPRLLFRAGRPLVPPALFAELGAAIRQAKVTDRTVDPPGLRDRLRKALGVVIPVSVEVDREGKLQVFRRPEGRRGLVWRAFGGTLLIVCLFDLGAQGERGFRLHPTAWVEAGVGLVLMPRWGGRPVFSSFFRDHPGAADLFRTQAAERAWANAAPANPASDPGRVTAAPFLYGPRFAGRRWGDWLTGPPIPLPGSAWRAFLVVPLGGATPPSPWAAAWRVLIGLGLLTGSCLVVERTVFGRGFPLTVPVVLWGGFLFVSVLPLSLFDALLRSSIDREIADRRQEVALSLHDDLVGLDEAGRLNLASYTHFLKSVGSVEALERLSRLRFDPASGPKFLEKSFQTLWDKDILFLHNFVGVATGGQAVHFVNFYSDIHAATVDDPLTRRMVRRAREDLRRLGFDPRDGTPGGAGGDLVAGYQEDLVTEALLTLMGPDAYLAVLQMPERLFELRFLYSATFLVQIPITWRGRLWMLASWFWNREALDQKFLKTRLPALQDPSAGRYLMAFNGYRHRVTPVMGTWAGIHARRRILAEMSRNAHFTGVNARLVDGGDPDRPVVEAMPGRYTNGVLAGSRGTSFLEEDRRRLNRRAAAWLVASLVFALVLATIAGWSFQKPLGELFAAVQRVGEGRFDTRLEIDREDEFGSLARVFNQMVRGLQEGSILRRFVSRSVRETVLETGGDIRAGEGRTTDVTIVFSSLAGFDEYQRTREPGEVFLLLEAHLEIVSTAVAAAGGDIDKVIGDKIMLVFPHDPADGGRSAVVRALTAIGRTRREWAGRGFDLSIAAGVNSGTVVAGIIGASRVRLDHTVVGDPVNLASRLACLAQVTGGSQVVIAAGSLALAGPPWAGERLPFRTVRGKNQQIEAFLVREFPS
ncbi:MAG: adenylate/guanylate cyclase domain-containing protein [Candidatus Riflebacteria bacterium]|nr:adenylate/guanylate cyclase domain-containing protein [Candidatus Riflebacteria bacterium]